MPKAEAGSAKAVGNAMKARGLTQLRFYCQICSKACRDANGFKCHIESESHMRQIQVIGNNGMSAIDGFSKEFQHEFVQLLSRRFGTRRIKANQVYQEYIQERHHLHMNATKWLTLTEFIKHLGREGIVKVDETEQGWFISWVDNSPAALAKADSLKKLERAKLDDEMRNRKFLEEQIERAKLEKESKKLEEGDGKRNIIEEEGLKRDGGNAGGIKLNIGFKKSKDEEIEKEKETSFSNLDPESKAGEEIKAAEKDSKPSTGFKFNSSSSSSSSSNPLKVSSSNPLKSNSNPLKLNSNPLKSGSSNPLKASSNPLKSNKPSSSSSSGGGSGSSQAQARTAAERIMQEELERKRKAVGPVMNANIKRQKW